MKKETKMLLLAGITIGVTIGEVTLISAADGQKVYDLNPVTVTAQRVETNDLDTPANVTVVTSEKIENAGYKNAFDVISNQLGVSSTGYGDAGQDFGLSSGRTVVRGYDRGTLVMVNGIPMNLKNYNSLSGIPVGMIEKVEIVKGAAGTLYGSEAMGGLVNIITKTPKDGKESFDVHGTVGNYYNDFGLTYSGPNMILDLSRSFDDKRSHSNAYPSGSSTDWWVGKGQTNRAALSAKLSDNIGFNMFYEEGNITRGSHNKAYSVGKKNGKTYKDVYSYRYDNKKLTAGFNYDGKENGIKATVGYNFRQIKGYDYIKNGPTSSNADLSSYIADVQKTWHFGEDQLTAGYTFKRENYEGKADSYRFSHDGVTGRVTGNRDNNVHRTDHALYMSYNKVFSPKFGATLGLRGERIYDPHNNQNVLNPQFQTLYKINDSTSWYIDIGRGFQMPTIDSYYGRRSFSDIKPEKGWTYETGIKKQINDNQSLKFSVFHMDFDNKLGWSDKDENGLQHPINKGKFRNTGVEVEYARIINNNWDYSVGLGYSNPEVKDPTVDNAVWTQDSARLDGVLSVNYHSNKVHSSLTWKYLGDREDYNRRQIPYLSRVTWHTTYDFTDSDSISLTLNNLFDHENYSNRYGNLELPYNWRLSYSHRF